MPLWPRMRSGADHLHNVIVSPTCLSDAHTVIVEQPNQPSLDVDDVLSVGRQVLVGSQTGATQRIFSVFPVTSHPVEAAGKELLLVGHPDGPKGKLISLGETLQQ